MAESLEFVLSPCDSDGLLTEQPSEKIPKRVPGRKRGWKKPEGKPKRPLSAYNLFFQYEREEIVRPKGLDGNDQHTKTKIGFAALARGVATKWRELDDVTRSWFEAQAAIEKRRYTQELEAWNKMRLTNLSNTAVSTEHNGCTFNFDTNNGTISYEGLDHASSTGLTCMLLQSLTHSSSVHHHELFPNRFDISPMEFDQHSDSSSNEYSWSIEISDMDSTNVSSTLSLFDCNPLRCDSAELPPLLLSSAVRRSLKELACTLDEDCFNLLTTFASPNNTGWHIE